MEFLIVFFIIWVSYMAGMLLFIHRRACMFRKLLVNNQDSIMNPMIQGMRFIFITSIFILGISYFILLRVPVAGITSPQIGIALATGVVIFYVLFLLWDIKKVKWNQYCIDILHIEQSQLTVINRLMMGIISTFALLLHAFVLSVMLLIEII